MKGLWKVTPTPDIKFFSLYALRKNYKTLQKTHEPILISADTFWTINNEALEGINYTLAPRFTKEWADEKGFSATFQYVFKELITAIYCNETAYTDEVVFVGMDWELDKANKYFGDAMLINAYDYTS